MANSKFEYTRLFETPDPLIPNTFIVIRIDGRGFHRFTKRMNFVKPNDIAALNLMNAAAQAVFREIPDVCVGYGVSDEYSFVLSRNCELFERRASKLITTVASTFTAYYIHLWPTYFPTTPLTPPLPTFDGRAVIYPTIENIRDYMSWRQVDCHINNLYNTTFHTLCSKGGVSPKDAENRLMGTQASDKNEILFKEFGMNYNNELEIFKKGSVVFRDYGAQTDVEQVQETADEDDRIAGASKSIVEDIDALKVADNLGTAQSKKDRNKESNKDRSGGVEKSNLQAKRELKRLAKSEIVVLHEDIIKDDFWEKRLWILDGSIGKRNRFAGVS